MTGGEDGAGSTFLKSQAAGYMVAFRSYKCRKSFVSFNISLCVYRDWSMCLLQLTVTVTALFKRQRSPERGAKKQIGQYETAMSEDSI